MYKVQPIPDSTAILNNNATVTPLVTLKDEYGGISHIINDDHCFVLINKVDIYYEPTTHWYQEAVDALYNFICTYDYEL